jgi:hypothetical protein
MHTQAVLVVDADDQFRTRYLLTLPSLRRSPSVSILCGDIGSIQPSMSGPIAVPGCQPPGPTPITVTNNFVVIAANGVSAEVGDTIYTDCRLLP